MHIFLHEYTLHLKPAYKKPFSLRSCQAKTFIKTPLNLYGPMYLQVQDSNNLAFRKLLQLLCSQIFQFCFVCFLWIERNKISKIEFVLVQIAAQGIICIFLHQQQTIFFQQHKSIYFKKTGTWSKNLNNLIWRASFAKLVFTG